MPALRTTRTTSNPITPPDSTPQDSTPLDSTAPDTPDETVPESAAQHAAATSNPAADDKHDPTSPSKGTTTATDPDGTASRPRRRTPRTATTAGAGGTTITDSATPSDATAPDAQQMAPAASEAAAATDTTDATEGGSPIEDDVWATLRKQPGATATELARSVPASRKVVLAMLNRWCAEGSVDTTPGATARAATRYFALPSTLPTPASVPPADTEHEPTEHEPTEHEPTEHEPTEHEPTGHEPTGHEPTGHEPTGHEPTGHEPTATPATTTGVGKPPDAEPKLDTGPDAAPGALDAVTAPSAEAVTGGEPTAQSVADVPTAGTDADRTDVARTNSSGSVRLGSGALHGMVEDFLREHAAGEHGPVSIAKSIGRSSGAVANALERMVGSGWAVRTSDKPKRYQIADTTDDTRTETIPTDWPSTPTHTPISAPDAPAVDGPAVDGPAVTQNGPGRARGARAAGRSGTDTDASGAAAASGSAPTREGAVTTRR